MRYKPGLYSLAILATLIAAGFYILDNYFPHRVLLKTSFKKLPHWQSNNIAQSFDAFKKSCAEIAKRDPAAPFSTVAQGGHNRDWQTICLRARQIKTRDADTLRHFFETQFTPYRISNNFHTRGLFTGYYLPLIHGRLTPDKNYRIPIYALPPDLIRIPLGQFRPELVGKTVIAQLQAQTLRPYPDRAAINHGALAKNTPVLAWSNSALDVFFAQIQGSAIVQLPHQQSVLINYAGHNGHSYTAIGKVLVADKALAKKDVSMQTIRAWLTQHPDKMQDVLDQNASYVFFNLLKTKEPLGAEHIPLTPAHSLAVDTRYIPLGAPIWLDTVVPTPSQPAMPFQQLLIAQDTGGAIKGMVRGDVYWGAGESAALTAGQMQSVGRYWILLPKQRVSQKDPSLRSG